MLEVNELAILVSALLALALGSIWYSPLVFGRHWQRATSLTDQDLALSTKAMTRALLVGFLSNVVLMYVIALFLRVAAVAELAISHVVALLVALFAASMASMVVWEQKQMLYFIIHVGYLTLIVLVGSTVLALWPW